MNMEKWYYRVWDNKKYLDLWSVNHTLAGLVIAGPLYYFSVRFSISFIIALILIIAWEVFEYVQEIKEAWQNSATDIITGIIGFLFLWHFLPIWSGEVNLWVYFISLAAWIFFEIWGYLAYRAGVK
jgi:hypothetical protein